MELFIICTAVLQSVGLALGLGSSTIAVTNFFVALSDGKIDDGERRMMGVVYIMLRISMGIILITTTVFTLLFAPEMGLSYFTPYVTLFWLLIVVLFINAILMTLHYIPMTLGPALQAASWYTMGISTALVNIGIFNFNFTQSLVAYASMILLATVIINGILIYQKKH